MNGNVKYNVRQKFRITTHETNCIFVIFHIFTYWVNVVTFYLVYRLVVASPSLRTTNHPWKGRGYVTWPVLNFGCSIHISGMAKELSNLILERLYRLAESMTNHTWEGHGLAHVTHFCMHNCGLRKISLWQAVDWNQHCSRRQTCVRRTLDGRRCALLLKLHRFDFSL